MIQQLILLDFSRSIFDLAYKLAEGASTAPVFLPSGKPINLPAGFKAHLMASEVCRLKKRLAKTLMESSALDVSWQPNSSLCSKLVSPLMVTDDETSQLIAETVVTIVEGHILSDDLLHNPLVARLGLLGKLSSKTGIQGKASLKEVSLINFVVISAGVSLTPHKLLRVNVVEPSKSAAMTSNTEDPPTKKPFHTNYEPLHELTEGVLRAAAHWSYDQLKAAEKKLLFHSCVTEEQSLFSELLHKMYGLASPEKRLPLVEFQFPPPKHTVPLAVLVPIAPPPLRDDDIQLLPTCGVQEVPETPPSVTTTTTSVLKPPKKGRVPHLMCHTYSKDGTTILSFRDQIAAGAKVSESFAQKLLERGLMTKEQVDRICG
ncbi:hypothetical protein Pelo_4081 [Pelomyxa schiedti]|nr:hypothetical protein Pelo_4081 [Pelomyxa schiedti]